MNTLLTGLIILNLNTTYLLLSLILLLLTAILLVVAIIVVLLKKHQQVLHGIVNIDDSIVQVLKGMAKFLSDAIIIKNKSIKKEEHDNKG